MLQKWKQRFFVLHKPFGSLPDYYQLSYYNSEHCSKKKGTIDLSQCEQIIEALDSDHYPFLFAIKTEYRSRVCYSISPCVCLYVNIVSGILINLNTYSCIFFFSIILVTRNVDFYIEKETTVLN